MPKTKIGFFSSLLLSCAIFLLSTPSFGSCNRCQNVTLSLLRSINQKTININRNLIKNSCLGTVLLTGPTTITQEGKYTLCNDMVGPIIIATDNVFLNLNNFAIKTPTAGSIQVGAIIIQAGCKNIEINGGRIQGPLEDTTKTKSLGNNSSFAGIIVAKGARHVSLIELDFIHLDTGIVYQGEQEAIISYPICFGCTFYNCLQAIQAEWTDDAVFDKLFVQHGQTGLSLNNCSGCLIAESQISDMRLSSEDISGVGIYMLGGGDNEISANNIRDCQNRGIWSIETTGLSVKANDITRIGDSARTAVQTKTITAIEDAAGIELDITKRAVIVANTISNVKAGKTAVGLRDYGTNSIVEQNLLFDVATSDQEGESAGILGMLRPENNSSYDSNTVKDVEGTGIKIDPIPEVVELPEPNVVRNITHQCGYGLDGLISNAGYNLFDAKPALSNYSLDQKDSPFKPLPDFNPGKVISLAWSPSGEYLAIGIRRGDNKKAHIKLYYFNRALFTLKLDQKVSDTVLENLVGAIAWSPNGRHLAFGTADTIYIYRFDPVQIELTLIKKTRVNKVTTIAWFPRKLATLYYLAVGSQYNFINVYQFDGSNLRLLTHKITDTEEGKSTINWIGDGGHLALHKSDQSIVQIYEFDRSSLTFVESLENASVVSWSSFQREKSSGRYLAVKEDDLIKLFYFTGSHLRAEAEIIIPYEKLYAIDWSPSENAIVVSEHRPRKRDALQIYNIKVVSSLDSKQTVIIPGPIYLLGWVSVTKLAWAPDAGIVKGNYIVGLEHFDRINAYQIIS